MNDQAFDRIAEAFMAAGPNVVADRVLDAAFEEVHRTRQRRAMRVPWRFPPMNTFAKAAIAAALVVAVGAVGLAVLGPGFSGIGGLASPEPTVSPTPVPAPTATPAPTPTPLPAITETFTSAGVTVSYPAGWTRSRAEQAWVTGHPSDCELACADRIEEQLDDSAFIEVASRPLGDLSGTDWRDEYLAEAAWEDCGAFDSQPLTIDGATGALIERCPPGGLMLAVAWDDTRAYSFVAYRIDDRDWFLNVLSTVQIR